MMIKILLCSFMLLTRLQLETIYIDSGDRVTLPLETTLSTVYVEKVP